MSIFCQLMVVCWVFQDGYRLVQIILGYIVFLERTVCWLVQLVAESPGLGIYDSQGCPGNVLEGGYKVANHQVL